MIAHDDVEAQTLLACRLHTCNLMGRYGLRQHGLAFCAFDPKSAYQSDEPGHANVAPYWFSPNLGACWSDAIPECRMAAWGQHSLARPFTERIFL